MILIKNRFRGSLVGDASNEIKGYCGEFAVFETLSQKESQLNLLQIHCIFTVFLQSDVQFLRLRIHTRTRLFSAEYEFVGYGNCRSGEIFIIRIKYFSR